MLDDDDFERVIALPDDKKDQLHQQSSSSDEYRVQSINYWRMASPIASWKRLACECFLFEMEKTVDEVKKHFQRKLGMLLSHSYSISFCIYIVLIIGKIVLCHMLFLNY